MKQFQINIFIVFSILYLSDCGTTKIAQTYINPQIYSLDDTSRFVCVYQFKFLFDTIKMIYKEDLNVIKIGDVFTKSYCYQTNYIDSLWNNMEGGRIFWANQIYDAVVNKKGDVGLWQKGPYQFYIYKDYQKEIITVRDHVSSYPFIYEEELKPQDWIIMEDTTDILGYSCQKAKCTFRSRDWIAWFTPEIPISEGPYKFYGLPGLIMKLQDNESHYSFEINEFKKTNEPIYITVNKYDRPMDRLSLLKLLMNRTGTDLTAIQSAKIGIVASSDTKHYDHIERDYK